MTEQGELLPGTRAAPPRPAARGPRPFVFKLRPDELAVIRTTVGGGGHQRFHEGLVAQLAQTGDTIELDDEGLGALIRHAYRYGDGGYQSRLRRAFGRSLRDLLKLR